jgi:hypothetical protein
MRLRLIQYVEESNDCVSYDNISDWQFSDTRKKSALDVVVVLNRIKMKKGGDLESFNVVDGHVIGW